MATSLVERGGLDEADLYDRFLCWAEADPPDVDVQTRAVLGSGLPWNAAAAEHVRRTARAAGNGSLMRTTPAAGEGCVVFHELVRAALDGGNPLDAVPTALEVVAADARPARVPGIRGAVVTPS